MNKLSIAMFATAITFSASSQAATSLNTVTERASYTLGVDLAKSFANQGVEVDTKALVAGMNDVINNAKLQLTDQEMTLAVEEVKQQVKQKQLAAQKAAAEANAAKGSKFLAENKNKKGVKVMPSGLQYIVITEGEGEYATEDDYLTAHYRGTLIDGTEFDSSFNRGAPIEFQMSNVIKGWGEALKKMKPGSKWKIFVPPALGYGSHGAGQKIGPNETLIFEIELLSTSKTAPSR